MSLFGKSKVMRQTVFAEDTASLVPSEGPGGSSSSAAGAVAGAGASAACGVPAGAVPPALRAVSAATGAAEPDSPLTPSRRSTGRGMGVHSANREAPDALQIPPPSAKQGPGGASASGGSNTLGLSDAWLLNGINFLIVDRDRPGVFVATFLLMHGWEERHIGAVVFLKAIVGLFVQAPMGDLVDRSTYKRSIGLACNAVVSATSLCLLGMHRSRAAVAALLVAQGIALTAVIPVIYSLTLGIVGHGPRMEQQTADNEVYCHLGTALYAIGASACALHGDDAGPFYLVAALAVGACVLIAAVRPEAIDLRASRGLDASPSSSTHSAGDLESAAHPALRSGGQSTPGPGGEGRASAAAGEDLNREASPYLALFAETRVLAFLATMLLFHFANAAMLPLLSQYLAIGSSRLGIFITGANIAIAQIVQALTAGAVGLALQSFSMKSIFLLGLAVLPVRGMLITFLLQAPFDATYYLILTQVLDGISHGVYSVLCVLVTEQIMHGTGRFSFMLGVGQTCHFVGDAFSNLLGEYLAGHYGYVPAFQVLTACSFVPVFLYAVFMPSDDAYAAKADRLDSSVGSESRNPLVPRESEAARGIVTTDRWWGGPVSRGGEISVPVSYGQK